MKTKVAGVLLVSCIAAGYYAWQGPAQSIPGDLRDAPSEIEGAILGNDAAQDVHEARAGYGLIDLAGDIDIAESGLRVLLGRPALVGAPYSEEACKKRLGAALALVNIESRRPGLLKHANINTQQFARIKTLFRELEDREGFYYSEMASIPMNGRAQVMQSEISPGDVGKEVNLRHVANSMDVAESSLRELLGSGHCEIKIKAALRLLNVQVRFPGLLEGSYSFEPEWHQYRGVVEAYKRLGYENKFF